MKKSQVNIESMRYKIPKTQNRFWQVHKTFIFLCLFVFVTLANIVCSAIIMNNYREILPLKTIFVFCEVENENVIEEITSKNSLRAYVYFVNYDDQFKSDEQDLYNFDHYPNMPSNEKSYYEYYYLCVLNHDLEMESKYSIIDVLDFNIDPTTPQNAEQIDFVIGEVLKNG